MVGEERPLVSVCIPVYNGEKYVGAAIESVLAQSLQDFELVVLDNCSTDETINVVKRYDDFRIRLVLGECNVGAEGNWNRALKEARGEFVKLVCADDFLYPTCLERELAVFLDETNASVVLVSCARDVVDESGARIMARGSKHSGYIKGAQMISKTVRAGTNLLGEPAAVLLRAEVLAKAGEFDGSIPYVIDVDFWRRVLSHGDAYIIRDALCAFRISSNSWSVEVSRSQSSDFRKFIARLAADPRHRLPVTDRLIGGLRARINSALRRFFYKVILEKRKP